MRRILLLSCLSIIAYFFSDVDVSTVEENTQRAEAKAISLPAVNATRANNVLTRANFEDHITSMYNEIGLKKYDLELSIFRLAMVGYYSLEREGALNDRGLLTVIDFAKPSTAKRFYTIDLKNKDVKYHTYVAHGRNTGQNMATQFSNTPHSNQSSLGFYVTGETYVGSKGYSLRLDGKEKNFNSNIRRRAVVMHAADYATENWIKKYGRLGRSQGCPALPPHLNRQVIDDIKGRTAIFTYYPDETYLKTSQYLRIDQLFEQLDRAPIQLATASPQGRS